MFNKLLFLWNKVRTCGVSLFGFLEVSRLFGDNKHLAFEAFFRTHHVLKIVVSMEQHFLEHAVFLKTLRVPNSCSPLTVEILPKRPVALTSSLPCGPNSRWGNEPLGYSGTNLIYCCSENRTACYQHYFHRRWFYAEEGVFLGTYSTGDGFRHQPSSSMWGLPVCRHVFGYLWGNQF